MKRPECRFDPGLGLLRAKQFQIAYATNDIERACACFRDQYGIGSFQSLAGPLANGGRIHVELAWVGDTMYELVSASGPGSELFNERLPTDVFAIRHHHLGFLLHAESEWLALMEEIDRRGWRVRWKSHTPGFLRSCMVESEALGHFLEYLFPEPRGLAFFENIPSN